MSEIKVFLRCDGADLCEVEDFQAHDIGRGGTSCSFRVPRSVALALGGPSVGGRPVPVLELVGADGRSQQIVVSNIRVNENAAIINAVRVS